jgi:hypothetical protein
MPEEKYSPKYCTEITKQMAAGLTDTEVISKWEISRGTFYRWKKEHPEFKEAADIGKNMYDANMIGLGRAGMLKQIDMDYRYWKDLCKNVHGLEDPKIAATNNMQINIDTMNVLNEQTNEELLMFIKDQMEKHPELSNIIEGEIVDD